MKIFTKKNFFRNLPLTFLPSIWFMAADSLRVHSATTLARCSFMKSMNALSGFLMWCFSFLDVFNGRSCGSPRQLSMSCLQAESRNARLSIHKLDIGNHLKKFRQLQKRELCFQRGNGLKPYGRFFSDLVSAPSKTSKEI